MFLVFKNMLDKKLKLKQMRGRLYWLREKAIIGRNKYIKGITYKVDNETLSEYLDEDESDEFLKLNEELLKIENKEVLKK